MIEFVCDDKVLVLVEAGGVAVGEDVVIENKEYLVIKVFHRVFVNETIEPRLQQMVTTAQVLLKGG